MRVCWGVRGGEEVKHLLQHHTHTSPPFLTHSLSFLLHQIKFDTPNIFIKGLRTSTLPTNDQRPARPDVYQASVIPVHDTCITFVLPHLLLALIIISVVKGILVKIKSMKYP